MKYLILGGAGFIGLHLAEALAADGIAVRIFDRPGLPLPAAVLANPAIEYLEGDFINEEDVATALADCGVVVHLISTTLPKTANDNPAYDLETNVMGTLRLLDQMHDAGVDRIVFASSGGTVYGIPRSVPITEDHVTEPISAYGVGKLAIEKYLQLYHVLHGIDYRILRLANPYGERQRVHASQGAVAVFLHRALHNETIEIWGDGSVTRDYLHVSDVVAAFRAVIQYRGEQRLFNVGSGAGLSVNQLLAGIETALDRPARRRYLPGRRFDVPVNVLDCSRIQRAVGWRPVVGLTEGIARTLSWLKQDR